MVVPCSALHLCIGPTNTLTVYHVSCSRLQLLAPKFFFKWKQRHQVHLLLNIAHRPCSHRLI